MSQNFSEKTNYYTIAFYNLENLFDTLNDARTLDDDFTEDAPKNWNETRFQKKISHLGKVISNISVDKFGFPPILLGVAEVENSTVLDALVQSKPLRDKAYAYVHFDSPDERGIDTALLYRKKYVEILSKKTHTLFVTNELGERDFTRDILHVHVKLEEQPLHILVNHWPSRRQGTEETSHKRIAAASKNLEIIDAILSEDANARIIIMGDFNDDPQSESIQKLTSESFYNPMEVLLSNTQGSLSHEDTWHLFDQIIISHNFLQGKPNPFQFESAHIYNPESLREKKEKYKHLPLRTYVGTKYLGGFSDHFPVFSIFSISSIDFKKPLNVHL
ncbi:MAG: endonuclease [Flavobacteriaceae bacterium]|nr:endonuclease [Flavobacteriaceae bacterium]